MNTETLAQAIELLIKHRIEVVNLDFPWRKLAHAADYLNKQLTAELSETAEVR